MAVTAAMVKELREMTGAGMMDCKKALTATEGDMDAAVEFLRKNGQAKAEKKAGRIAAEGLCTDRYAACSGTHGCVEPDTAVFCDRDVPIYVCTGRNKRRRVNVRIFPHLICPLF